ncbi:MAG: HAD-IA family hydrolase [Candidatus Saccharibacteria bacterium]|nr:HAD-IA family hydrolase [Candidatus Saccharibacteria bacterium]
MKVILFDSDGVINLPGEFFSQIYAKSHGLDPEPFEEFFKGPYAKVNVGQTDLRELLIEYKDLWQSEDPDAIMKFWFESENIKNEPLLELIQQIRASGIKCYFATNQSKYRGEYMKQVMFPGLFDGSFVSADLGVQKPDLGFYEKVIELLRREVPNLKPEEIMFFDDTQENVDAAKSLGIDAHFYEGIDQIKSLVKV